MNVIIPLTLTTVQTSSKNYYKNIAKENGLLPTNI